MILRNKCNYVTTKHLGMTLIEVLIVIAIVGVLVAITYPSYQQYVLKTHRSIAIADLLHIQLQLEQSKTQTGDYDFQSVVDQGRCMPVLNCQSGQRYQLSIIPGSVGVNRYQIQAIPQNEIGQVKDKCGTLILNSAGVGTAVKQGRLIKGCW